MPTQWDETANRKQFSFLNSEKESNVLNIVVEQLLKSIKHTNSYFYIRMIPNSR